MKRLRIADCGLRIGKQRPLRRGDAEKGGRGDGSSISVSPRLRVSVSAFLLLVTTVLLLAHLAPNLTVPSFQDVRAAYRPSDVALLDRWGKVIHELRIDATRRRLAWTPLAEISPALQAAVLMAEDRRFYRHGGVDGQAVIAALVRWIKGQELHGASTISMQVASLLSPELRRESGITRKWRQMRLAWALEQRWSKTEIVEAYLNLTPFRGEVEGVAAAAGALFDKVPHGLTETEVLVLAALLRAPNAEPETVFRRAWALREVQQWASAQENLRATVARACAVPSGMGPRVQLAPHVAHHLLDVPQMVSVHSTLDSATQRIATETLRRHLLEVRARHVDDGAVLVVDNATGEILAYVGGSGSLSRAPYVDNVRARRQAGSTLKPFLYALAFEHRLLTPASLIEDAPLDLAVATGLYRPRNYDEQFRGLVTARTALAASLNVPAVRTIDLVGTETFMQQLQRLGFAGMRALGDYYGPSLALGAAEVSLWELVNAYRTLANGGVSGSLRLTAEEVQGPKSPTPNPQPPFSKEAAFLTSHILADRESRSATFGLENPLATRFWSAVKTGTSKDMRDNWCIGYTRRYTVGVWVGNVSGTPMHDVSGVTGAAPVWLEIMNWLHATTPSLPLPPPAGVLAKGIAFPQALEPTRIEWFLAGTEPVHSVGASPDGLPGILTPVTGTIIALDPDIPAAQQRLLCEAHTGGAPLQWVLDGKKMGVAAQPLRWVPRPGQHTLALVDSKQQVGDAVTFVVRGSVAFAGPQTAAGRGLR